MEAQFYFQAVIEETEETLALCSLYSIASEYHRGYSHGALNVYKYEGEGNLVVIQVKSILSAVGMVPFRAEEGESGRFYLVEKFALGVIDTGVIVD